MAAGSATPIYRQIVEQVALRVADGTLKEGAALPSVRRLAERLTVNPNTVSRAYGELVQNGTLESRAGRGVFVGRPRPVFSQTELNRRLDAAADALVAAAATAGVPADALGDAVRAAVERRLKAEGIGGHSKSDVRSAKSGRKRKG